jgi:uncharacterized membrane protein YhaH (DUF805 family)
MKYITYYFKALKKFRTTEGRANRTELLSYLIIHLLVLCTLAYLIKSGDSSIGGLNLILVIYNVIGMWALFTLLIRRLHDLDKSGLYFLLVLIPVLNIALAVYLFWKGQDEMNEYGDIIF